MVGVRVLLLCPPVIGQMLSHIDKNTNNASVS